MDFWVLNVTNILWDRGLFMEETQVSEKHLIKVCGFLGVKCHFNILWNRDLLMEETQVSGKKCQLSESYWQN